MRQLFQAAIAAVAFFALIGGAHAQPVPQTRNYKPLGFCYNTTVTTAANILAMTGTFCSGTTTAKLADVAYAIICAWNGPAYWRDDGTAPTTSQTGGNQIASNNCMPYWGSLEDFQYIGAAGVTVTATLYK